MKQPAAVEPQPYPTPRVMALCNSKGGSNKSTASINLGAELAVRGFQVLVVDLDHQGDATNALRLDGQVLAGTTNEVLLGERGLLDTLVPTLLDTLWLLPASPGLFGLDTRLQLEQPDDFHLILRRILEQEAGGFDYVVLDCPGNLQALSIMALATADAFVVPMKPEFFFLDNAKELLQMVQGFTESGLTSHLQLAGLFFSPFHPRRRSTVNNLVVKGAKSAFPGMILPHIRQDEKISLAQVVRRPIQLDHPDANGTQDFRELTDAILNRMGWPLAPGNQNARA